MKKLPLTHIFITSKVPSKKLMIILHGRGDTAAGFSFLPPYLDIDEMNYILLDAPNDFLDGYSWYDLPPNQHAGILHSRDILTQTLDILFEEQFDAGESFLFGFSQGSLLVFEFGARYHKVLAGYIGISGYIYEAHTLLEEMNPEVKKARWLCTHGREDELLPYDVSKAQVDILQKGGFDVEFIPYNKSHTMADDELRMLEAWIKAGL
ncbi:MAG TPA: serine esterase [Sulfurovum sp.]|jgi:phospholipase/carboxylesterase|nr:MAG: serine esterase [Sulfurovum sp. 35-42-20]OYZ25294.1 MAG: serine esterase [Sulfurovum sp. 16-42-52]OYZ48501.1 MAG: serine esterase [Sulfurovum sp. 24-42-9]OZA44169.1 MAG: serine esterase [Sulfurovum sp. 17-42-90]OZA61301.1 MAG: serine esterase [Sulfurovum sp. 39-42-12]HQR74742.1 serine esterase [Sulfurovum sp.]